MKRVPLLLLTTLAAAAISACTANVPAPAGCESTDQCGTGTCVFNAAGVGRCVGAVGGDDAPPVSTKPSPAPAGGGEGEGEGEGEGAPAAPPPVDTTPHFFPGAFVGGEAASSSAHFTLVGGLSSMRRP